MKTIIFPLFIFCSIVFSSSKTCAQQNQINFYLESTDLGKSVSILQYQRSQSEYNPWTIHRKVSAIGLAGSMAATFVGALAMGDEFFATTVIPVVGPFVTIARIENDPNSEYLPGGKQLLTASGIVQSTFLVYFVTSLIGESNYRGKYLSSNVSVAPIYASKGIGVSMNVRF